MTTSLLSENKATFISVTAFGAIFKLILSWFFSPFGMISVSPLVWLIRRSLMSMLFLHLPGFVKSIENPPKTQTLDDVSTLTGLDLRTASLLLGGPAPVVGGLQEKLPPLDLMTQPSRPWNGYSLVRASTPSCFTSCQSQIIKKRWPAYSSEVIPMMWHRFPYVVNCFYAPLAQTLVFTITRPNVEQIQDGFDGRMYVICFVFTPDE